MTKGQDTDIIASSNDDLLLFIGLHIDPGLFSKASEFTVNFRLIEVATNQSFNNYWSGLSVGLKPYAPALYVWMYWPQAAFAGVRNSARSAGSMNKGDGLYLYRPYILLYSYPFSELGHPQGDSEFAVAEDHYLLLESGN